MNVGAIARNLRAFIRQHRAAFSYVPTRGSALLELGALSVTAEHYRVCGYNVMPRRLRNGYFVVKTTARGYPSNFSYFDCISSDHQKTDVEVHANLQVESAFTSKGIYVVDVGVVTHGIQTLHHKQNFKALANHELLTFLEVKNLVTYPMLLAQFFGMVHEIRPRFLSGRRRPRGFRYSGHPDPALLTTGYLTNTGRAIVENFENRNLKISIVTNFELVLSKMRGGRVKTTPFDYNHIHKGRNI